MEIPPVSAVAGLCILAVLTPLAAPAQETGSGVQIAWASDAFATNLMADGVTTFGGSALTIQFELGSFKEGFDPATASRTEWAANWVVLQSASYDTSEDQVIQTGTLYANSPPFTENAQAYIWGFTTKDIGSGEAEWIVIAADAWNWPSASSTLPVTFSVSDVTEASEMLAGSVNGTTSDGVDYHMRLEAIVVPEPAVPLLAVIAGAGFLIRRRR